MADTREILRRGLGDFAPQPDGYERVLRRRDRKRRDERIVAVAVAAAIVLIGTAWFVGAMQTEPEVLEPSPGDRPVFERTATIGGISVTSPSDWLLVDYWATFAFNPEALAARTIPMFEVTNFDAGLSTPVCGREAGAETRLPADGIAILVTTLGDGATEPELCGGTVDATTTGTVGGHPYRAVMRVGPEVSDDERAEAEAIWDSIAATSDITFHGRRRGVRYVLDGWEDGSSSFLLEVLPSEEGGVTLSKTEASPEGLGEDSVESAALADGRVIEGDLFGLVTEDAARVEYHRAGLERTFDTRLLDLSASLGVALDAFVILPPTLPVGGPSEALAFDADGEVLGSTLPLLVRTERVGTVRAFGASWDVFLSYDEEGFIAAMCVRPASDGSAPTPCERGWGGGHLLQTFATPVPAVFITQGVGDIVEAIDVVTDDGRVYHAVMIPIPDRDWLGAVHALEGEGPGRFVYHLTDGRTDEGPPFEWNDVGQVVGEGDFSPPDTT